jgi:hypothetical protein
MCLTRRASPQQPGRVDRILRMVIDATGFLHDVDFQPEKSLRQIDPMHMARSFAINATGPRY